MLDLERRCPAAAHWSQQQYDDLFRKNKIGGHRLVLVVNENPQDSTRASVCQPRPPSGLTPILGFLIANQAGPEWELENLVVAPALRRKGLATGLFTALLAHAREAAGEQIFLEVRESNLAARNLYVRLGFEENGRRRLYYANPSEDAVLYRLNLL